MKTENLYPKQTLSLLWIFLTLNYIFCDVFTLMYSEELKMILTGKMGDMEITQPFLLTFAFIMEIPMVMILLSRFLKYKTNRFLNIIFGVLLTLVQAGSLFADSNTMHYIFFSIIEISTSVCIVVYAWQWKEGLLVES